MSILGTDLYLMEGDLVIGPDGDLATVSDTENLRQALYLRLLADKGELILHPDYGSEIYKYISRVMTPDRREKLKSAVAACIIQDPRVEKVLAVEIEVAGRTVLVTARIQPIGSQKPVNLVFPFDAGGGASV